MAPKRTSKTEVILSIFPVITSSSRAIMGCNTKSSIAQTKSGKPKSFHSIFFIVNPVKSATRKVRLAPENFNAPNKMVKRNPV